MRATSVSGVKNGRGDDTSQYGVQIQFRLRGDVHVKTVFVVYVSLAIGTLQQCFSAASR